MARVLVDRAVQHRHRHRRRPGAGPDRGIRDGHLVVDGVGVRAGEPFHHVEMLAPRGHRADAVRDLAGEVAALDDQRVPVPVAARVAHPLLDRRIRMRAAVQRDDARVVDHLDHDHDVLRRLEDLVVVVVEPRRHRPRHAARDAAVVGVELEVGVEARAADGAVGALRGALQLLLDRRRPRQPAVRRIHDERGRLRQLALLQPVVVVEADRVAARAVVAQARLGIAQRPLLVGQLRLAGQVRGTLQGRRGLVRPHALQVRMAPGRHGSGLRRLSGGRRGQEQRRNDQRQQHGKDSMTHCNLLGRTRSNVIDR